MTRKNRGYWIFGIFLAFAFLLLPEKTVQAANAVKITSVKAISKEEIEIKAKTIRKPAGDGKYYLVKVNGWTETPVCILDSATRDKNVTFRLNTIDKVNIISKFGIAIKKENKWKLISNTKYLQNPEMLATNTMKYQLPSSKKGVHGLTDFNLDAKHALTTLNLNDLIGHEGNGEPYVYNGKTYYFTATRQKTVQEFVKRGICVTMTIFMNWSEENKDLIYPTGRQKGDYWYMLNTIDHETRETLEAAFCYLAEKFTTEDCLVSNWVVGNEVNSQFHWNHAANAGQIPLTQYLKAYVQEFQMLSSAVHAEWPEARVFVPLDNAWNIPVSEVGWTGKPFLSAFAKQLKKECRDTKWNLAYHAYSFPLTEAAYAKQRYVSNSMDSYYITPLNIEQLTKYIQKTYGTSTRIILSEQGYTGRLGGKQQAASILYAYYKAEFNPMIDAFHLRCERDNDIEAAHGYYFGLSDMKGRRREAYNMFKYMDTKKTKKYAKRYLKTIGAKQWKSIIPGYKASRFK